MLQPSTDFDRRRRHQTQLLQLAPQLVDACDPRLIEWLQNMLLERLDLGCELLDDDKIIVDDKVDQRVEDVILSVGQLLGHRLGPLAYRSVGRRGAMTNRYNIRHGGGCAVSRQRSR